ncbi:CCA tRNA nucleotidyltransferase [Patescibacteria group bacterium]|nr:MAG: CCA tRNA nucleotidyltransferase [Patescibacteria group bacterium]
MRKEDLLISTLSSHRELSFVDDFLFEHPTAGLYLVGGAIRDALLGRHPREIDFDFVVTGLAAEDVDAWFRTRGKLSLVGQHFGVYKFIPTGFSPQQTSFIDIALPRTETVSQGSLGEYKDFDVQSDPHLPIETDLSRRDFTINAMAFDVREKKLIDPFHGQEDLAQKTIRAVGNPTQRFTEDLSRILRGIRFASELNFVVEPQTRQAIKTLVPKLNLQKNVDGGREYVVPRETIGMELAKAFSRNPTRAIRELISQGVIQELFPSVQAIYDVDQTFLSPIEGTLPGELPIVVILLLRTLSQEEIHETLSQTGLDRLPRGSSQRTEAQLITASIQLLQEEFTPQQIASMRASEFEKKFFNGKGKLFIRCLELLEKKDLSDAIQKRRANIETRWLVDHDETIAPLLSGQDILAKGVPAGPEIRHWLDRVRDLQLDGSLMCREDALAWLERELNQKSSE